MHSAVKIFFRVYLTVMHSAVHNGCVSETHMLTKEKIAEVRERLNDMRDRKKREYLKRTRSYDGISYVGSPMRFLFFIENIERIQRHAPRFAAHVARVEAALASPLTRFVIEQQNLERLLSVKEAA